MSEDGEVTYQEFSEALERNWQKQYQLNLTGIEIPVLHGLIALAEDHPGIKDLGSHTHNIIKKIRGFTLDCFRDWGFTEEQVHYIDTMRERAATGEQLKGEPQ